MSPVPEHESTETDSCDPAFANGNGASMDRRRNRRIMNLGGSARAGTRARGYIGWY